ncbi:late expression factor 6 [Ectropis obliqua nucleopolyhedrovirus]|uniref:Late expression factor 6 n=1 Tax=Ectropis obliqua nucleopolyhedrovirus TaxID=59376 RepID=A0EYR9_9ABAC|nr:late expression factor 6 [Ectropis obliqua nucleopolyhedrovirus]ABI35700.1 late expression factor 6 [Ectropis obliqua nucleopolyhedrovirus]AGS47881.1 hypothetical protein wdlz-06GM27 [Ectropis obliqua nucleopolyhedrovirus]QWV59602.1 late expression factor 6 [Ectropis obliqua nucleopolyhedrovirus]UYO72808.1 late expression factor 6 [Ectropis obliqua nucleopolyhedrovirus]
MTYYFYINGEDYPKSFIFSFVYTVCGGGNINRFIQWNRCTRKLLVVNAKHVADKLLSVNKKVYWYNGELFYCKMLPKRENGRGNYYDIKSNDENGTPLKRNVIEAQKYRHTPLRRQYQKQDEFRCYQMKKHQIHKRVHHHDENNQYKNLKNNKNENYKYKSVVNLVSDNNIEETIPSKRCKRTCSQNTVSTTTSTIINETVIDKDDVDFNLDNMDDDDDWYLKNYIDVKLCDDNEQPISVI